MTPKTETKKERTHRSEAERIAELEAKIAGIKRRAVAKQAKALPEGQALVLAVRAVDRAARVATEAGNAEIAKALEAARATLAPAVVQLGLRVPAAQKGGRRRKGEAA